MTQIHHVAGTDGQQPARRKRPVGILSAAAGAALSGVLAGAIAFAAPAWAHDTLIASTPEAGEVLEESPEEILLEFSGSGLTSSDSIPNTIWVTDADGEHWEGDTEVEGSTMSTDLEDDLPDGEYEVLYRVVYSDGHSEEQSFGFEVAAGEADAEPADEAEGVTSAPADESPTAESPAAESPQPSETADASDTAGAEETENAEGTENTEPAGQSTAWWVGIGIGAVALVALAVMFVVVRRRLRGDGVQ